MVGDDKDLLGHKTLQYLSPDGDNDCNCITAHTASERVSALPHS